MKQTIDSARLHHQVYKENGLRGLYFGFSLHTLRDTVNWPDAVPRYDHPDLSLTVLSLARASTSPHTTRFDGHWTAHAIQGYRTR